ncbi:MAG TPA: MlaD family protein [Verrucomicrobiae bacterium]|nr:MlaD family protein [Verrucomicrobiae bacterium]
MDSKRLELKVGLFVFIGLALLAVAVIQFSKGTSLFRGTYTLRLHAVNVGGLAPRAGVLLAGVQVGSVSDIKLDEGSTNVTILLSIYKEYKIYGDARFVIEQSGFLGDKYISVIPTANQKPALQNGADVDCQEPFNLQEVARSASGFIQRIDETAKKLDGSVSDLQRVVLNDQTLTNFSVAVGNLRTFTEQAMGTIGDINAIIATNGSQASLAVSNVVLLSQELNGLAGSASALLATNGAEISIAVKNIESSTEILTNLMTDLQSGKGLAGTVLQNEQLATNVQTIANNLSITTSNLNRLGLWGILWAHKPKTTSHEP